MLVTPAQYVDLNSEVIYKLQIAKHSEGIDAAEINRLMSIINIKSTLEGDYTVYYTSEFKDVLMQGKSKNNSYSTVVIIMFM